MLGVTKDTVSQIIQKIKRKGMIIKDVDPNNLSRLVLRLLPKEETAHQYHEALHRDFDGLFNAARESATEENKAFKFMNVLEQKIDVFENLDQL